MSSPLGEAGAHNTCHVYCGRRTVIVDFHVHIFSPQVQADRTPYLQRDPIFRSMYGSARARIATAKDLIKSMDWSGIDVSVIQGFAWASQQLCAEHNEYLLEASDRHPGRLVPFCTVQALGLEEAVNEVERCGTAGARGLGELRPHEQGYGASALQGLWPAARRHGLALLLHASEPVGHVYPGKGGMTPGRLSALIAALPDWPVVLAHLGGGLPFYAAMPEVRAVLRTAYVDTAAWPLLYGPEVFAPLLTLFGEERVLFGSDFPLLDQGREVDRLRGVLPGSAADAVLGGNARRLLGYQV